MYKKCDMSSIFGTDGKSSLPFCQAVGRGFSDTAIGSVLGCNRGGILRYIGGVIGEVIGVAFPFLD